MFHTLLKKTQVAPGIEVPDSRFDDWFPKISLGQVVADSAVAGRIVTGLPLDNVSYEQLEKLPGKLKQAVEAREQNPSASLTELAAMMEPPITKPAMNNRMKKLIQLAREARTT